MAGGPTKPESCGDGSPHPVVLAAKCTASAADWSRDLAARRATYFTVPCYSWVIIDRRAGPSCRTPPCTTPSRSKRSRSRSPRPHPPRRTSGSVPKASSTRLRREARGADHGPALRGLVPSRAISATTRRPGSQRDATPSRCVVFDAGLEPGPFPLFVNISLPVLAPPPTSFSHYWSQFPDPSTSGCGRGVGKLGPAPEPRSRLACRVGQGQLFPRLGPAQGANSGAEPGANEGAEAIWHLFGTQSQGA